MIRSMQALWEVSKGGSEPAEGLCGMRSSTGWVTRVRVTIRRCLDWFVEY